MDAHGLYEVMPVLLGYKPAKVQLTLDGRARRSGYKISTRPSNGPSG